MQTNTTNHYNGSGNFPERLHYVLEEMARDHQEHIMGWDETGSGFQVHDRNLLEKEILPKYVDPRRDRCAQHARYSLLTFFFLSFFRQTKYTSFQVSMRNAYFKTRLTLLTAFPISLPSVSLTSTVSRGSPQVSLERNN
jgi:hypothetical protein